MAVIRAGPPPTGLPALPQGYYDLSLRIYRLQDVIEQADDPHIRERGREKLWRLCAQLQDIVDQALGPSPCPSCTGIPLEQAAKRPHQMRTCVRHDLAILQLRGQLTSPPGTDDRSNSEKWSVEPVPPSNPLHLWDYLHNRAPTTPEPTKSG